MVAVGPWGSHLPLNACCPCPYYSPRVRVCVSVCGGGEANLQDSVLYLIDPQGFHRVDLGEQT